MSPPSNARETPASGLQPGTARSDAEGDVVVLVVPRSGGADEVTARVVSAVDGQRIHTVIVVASGRGALAGRIHVSRQETYPAEGGSVPIDLRSVDELCDEDDDIYADERGFHGNDGIGRQLPWLRAALGEFAVVPVVMGDESPDFCRELGSAIGEVMYGQPTLLVAVVDVLEASDEDLVRFGECLEACDIDHVTRAVNSERVRLDGGGPLVSALIAADRRGARKLTLVHLAPPGDGSAGRLGAIISRA